LERKIVIVVIIRTTKQQHYVLQQKKNIVKCFTTHTLSNANDPLCNLILQCNYLSISHNAIKQEYKKEKMKFNLKVLPIMMQSPHIYRKECLNYIDVMLHQFYTVQMHIF